MMTSVSAPSSVHVSIIGPSECSDRVLVSHGNEGATSSTYMSMKSLVDSEKGKLINMKNLVQDEKLVVATLATLQSGGPSDIIKEELKYIIQSRRVAEGKEELKVDFSPPERNELTPQDVERREKRRERNRLAAQRSRERGKRKMDELMHEIEQLQSKNAELEHMFDGLSKERDRLKRALLDHLSLCPSYEEPLNLSLKDT